MAEQGELPVFFDGKSRDDAGFTELHFGNLYDQDENGAGERTDPATGERIDNSTENPEDYGFTVMSPDEFAEYLDAASQQELDTVDAWLAEQEKVQQEGSQAL